MIWDSYIQGSPSLLSNKPNQTMETDEEEKMKD